MGRTYKEQMWFNNWVFKVSDKQINPMGWHNYIKWYYAPQVKFKILRYIKGREFALMVPKEFPNPERSTRLMKVTNVQSFDFFYDVTGMKSKHTFYNFFSSVARYEGGIVSLPYDLDVRREAKKDWQKNHWKFMEGYDFFVDIDGTHENFKMTKFAALEVKAYFDINSIPYYLRFSGKGFHFIIPYKYFIDKFPDGWGSFDPEGHESVYKFFGRLARFLSENISEMVDEQIYDARRVVKVPFTLALYKEGYYVCLPLNSTFELQRFEYQDALYTNFTMNQVRYYDDKLQNAEGKVDKLINDSINNGYIKPIKTR